METPARLPLRAWEQPSLWESPRWDSFGRQVPRGPPTPEPGPWSPSHSSLSRHGLAASFLGPGSRGAERGAHVGRRLRSAAHFLCAPHAAFTPSSVSLRTQARTPPHRRPGRGFLLVGVAERSGKHWSRMDPTGKRRPVWPLALVTVRLLPPVEPLVDWLRGELPGRPPACPQFCARSNTAASEQPHGSLRGEAGTRRTPAVGCARRRSINVCGAETQFVSHVLFRLPPGGDTLCELHKRHLHGRVT